MMVLTEPVLTNSSSRRLRDHVACCPPLTETFHLPSPDGNGLMYTSRRVLGFSADAYATQFPSGENMGEVSMAGVLTNGLGSPGFQPDRSSPSSGRAMISVPVLGFCSVNRRYLPLG